MSDKIARLGIERDNDLMYYIKNGDVWAVPRKQKGRPKGKPHKVASTGLELDYSKYLYFVDGDGDVARKARALGGGRRKAKAPKPAKAAEAAAPSAPKTRKKGEKPAKAAVAATPSAPKTRKKGEAQLDREIEECLEKARKSGGGVAGAAGARKKRR